MDDVGDARAILLGIQVVMTDDHGAGIARMQFLKQSSHGSLLRLCARVGGLPPLNINRSSLLACYQRDAITLPYRAIRQGYFQIRLGYRISDSTGFFKIIHEVYLAAFLDFRRILLQKGRDTDWRGLFPERRLHHLVGSLEPISLSFFLFPGHLTPSTPLLL